MLTFQFSLLLLSCFQIRQRNCKNKNPREMELPYAKTVSSAVHNLSYGSQIEQMGHAKLLGPRRAFNQRSLRDSTISHTVCVGKMLVLKAICDALTH